MMKYIPRHIPWLPVIALHIIMLGGCKPDKLFTSLSPAHTNITFTNQLTESEEVNINQYLYAHNGGGVAIGDINNDSLPDLYFTANQLPNKLYLNKGDFVFEDITDKAGVGGLSGTTTWTTGIVMVDINHDGWLDMYVSQVSQYKSFTGKNQLFINNGDLTFTENAKDYNLDFERYSQHAAFFDYDLDGDLDMYQLNHGVHNPDVYGKSDLRFQRDSLAGDRLLKNVNGKFIDVSEAAGIYGGMIGYGLAVSIADIDNNGCPDIFVSNDFHENDYVYYNNCDGTFKEDIKGTLGHTSTFSMGNDIADINNDGLLDIITLDMKPEDEVIRKKSSGADPYEIFNYKLSYGYFYQYPRNMLQLNRGNLFSENVQFSEIGQLAGIDATDWSWSALLADLDNDGWKDIFITNGIRRRPIDLDYIHFTYNEEVSKNMSTLELAYKMPEGAVPNYAYRNSGKLIFENVSADWGLNHSGYAMGSAYADLDDDGDLDLVVNNLNEAASVYKNNSRIINENNFIKVKFEGNGKNTFGIGAVVEVEADNVKLIQTVSPSRGWLSSVEYPLTFGLGKKEKIDKLTVRWSGGYTQVIHDPKINSTITLRQDQAKQNGSYKPYIASNLFENVTEKSGITFIHKENAFNDFSVEPLMPHQLSCEGPSLTVGDVNDDGYDDFFIGGASGQAGELYFQKQGDTVFFEKYKGDVFDLDKKQEDTDAVFFDADQDGDVDLYVVSGGCQTLYGIRNEDRLYLNNGTGDLVKMSDALPKWAGNGSCVVAADFNADGYTDLFIGTRSIVGKYGMSPDSYLLWNNGKAKFSIDTTDFSGALRSMGMVTDAEWLSDSKELVVVGEWMPITFLGFHNDKIVKRELPNTSGWWNTIYKADIDQDGDADLLAGNRGLNSDIRATPQQPVGLYVNDFDKNYVSEPMLTYYRQNKSYLFAGMDEIKKQMPSIRFKYDNYSAFAGHTFLEVFNQQEIESSIRKRADMFQSVYLINEGESQYAIREFPIEVQFSPVYGFVAKDFNGDGFIDILTVGNFYGSQPSIGRFDASYGNCLMGNAQGDFRTLEPRFSGFSVYGETRDLQIISSKESDKIVVSRNNATPRLFDIRWLPKTTP